MAKDAAMVMANQSIELAQATGDQNYYLTPLKIHKLLYLAQCYMLSIHGRPLFNEEIEAHHCGPLVLGIQSIMTKRGLGPIRETYTDDEYVMVSMLRYATIDFVLRKYGNMGTAELVRLTIQTSAFQAVWPRVTDTVKPVIPKTLMRRMKDFFMESA